MCFFFTKRAFCLLLLLCGHVKLEVDDVGVDHDIVLALLLVLAGGLDIGLGAMLFQVHKRHRLSHNEATLKVRMDNTGGLRGLGTVLRNSWLKIFFSFFLPLRHVLEWSRHGPRPHRR